MVAVEKMLARLYFILRLGVVVGIVEGMEEEDWETGEIQFTTFNDRKFRMRSGRVYCKGGSVMHPTPVTDKDGWEVEPVDQVFFEDILLECVHMIYVEVCGQKVPIWANDDMGWEKSKNCLAMMLPQGFGKTVTKVQKPTGLMSLKLLAAEVARDHKGPLAMREFVDEICMDDETCNHMFSPPSWWIPL
jgi:hypothetical protein